MRSLKLSPRKFFAAAMMAALLIPAVLASQVFWQEASSSRKAASCDVSAGFADLAEKSMPAVVTVYTKVTTTGFGLFFMPRELMGGGSGFIVSSDGYILTNNHVVAKADSITVMVGVRDKEEYKAELVGADPEIDVALIKIDAKNLPVLSLGDSEEVRVGDWVAAIGSPFNYPHTLTVGVVSAKGRRLGLGNYDDFIQTDASINPGNSGGPLIDMKGRVVGINTLITSPTGGNVGIGFATPINLVKSILPQLRESGKVTRSWLGVSIMPVTAELAESAGLSSRRGAYVTEVVIGGPADKAGIEVGDVIIEFNGHKIDESRDLPSLASSYGVGRDVEVAWLRKGERMENTITLGKLPDRDEQAQLKKRSEAVADNILGLKVRDMSAEDRQELGVMDVQGVLVVEVETGSPAEQNGIKAGDVIVKINLVETRSVKDFNRAVEGLSPGNYVRINVRRGNSRILRMFKIPR